MYDRLLRNKHGRYIAWIFSHHVKSSAGLNIRSSIIAFSLSIPVVIRSSRSYWLSRNEIHSHINIHGIRIKNCLYLKLLYKFDTYRDQHETSISRPVVAVIIIATLALQNRARGEEFDADLIHINNKIHFKWKMKWRRWIYGNVYRCGY